MTRARFDEQTVDVHADYSPEALHATRRMREAIKGMRVAMLTTSDGRGHLRSRPMTTQQSEDDDELWFYTDARSGIIDDLTFSNHVNLTYLESSGKRFVSVTGIAHVMRDQNLLQRFWNKHAAEWFPDGPDRDPHLALLRVQLEEVEMWDAGARSLVRVRGLDHAGERDAALPQQTAPAYELPAAEPGDC